MEEVRQICGPSVPVLLVGCKRDLREDAIARGRAQPGQFVEKEQAKQVASQIGARSYHECSGLKNEGVDVSTWYLQGRDEKKRPILALLTSDSHCFSLTPPQAIFEAATRASMLVRTPGGTGIGTLEKRNSSKSEVGGCKCVIL